jgi:nitroreductase / dihydropteridine reductase
LEGDYLEFEHIVMNRYATKMFDGKKVPQENVDKLFEMIRFAPSSLNLQPWKIKVVEDDEIKGKLSAHSYEQPQIKSCSHLLVFCADTDIDGLINGLEKKMKKSKIEEQKVDGFIKMIQGFVARKKARGDDVLPWAQRQIYIALANALNGAKSLGFDSCPMEGFDPKGYSQVLGLPENLIPTVIVPIGYAADEPREKVRFEKEDIIF